MCTSHRCIRKNLTIHVDATSRELLWAAHSGVPEALAIEIEVVLCAGLMTEYLAIDVEAASRAGL